MSTWNKFCFTGGIIVTSVVLPGKSSVYGLWVSTSVKLRNMGSNRSPAGRLDDGKSWTCGIWCVSRWIMALRKHYLILENCPLTFIHTQTYEACDLGTLANQTLNGQPAAALTSGDPNFNNVLSYQPGQRLSSCTCPGEVHPGPQNQNGSYVGRAAPEIDVFEAQVSVPDRIGYVSQSVCVFVSI